VRDRAIAWIMMLLSASCILLAMEVSGQDDENAAAEAAQGKEEQKSDWSKLKLEDLFPEKSFFGPGARSAAFSHDGRYAAYLYRPYIERRHGNDLWLLDAETGEVTRLTSVVVMAEFQEDTRTVKEDREKKAKKEGVGKQKGEEDQQTESGERKTDEAPRIEDPVSGTWEGILKGGEGFGIPPEGVPFTLMMTLHDSNAVTGTMSVMGQSVELSGGQFDPRTSRITAAMVDQNSGQGASLSIDLSGEEMTGTIDIEAFGATFSLEGKRTSKETGTKPASFAQDDAKRDGDNDDDEREEQEEDIDGDVILGNWVSEKDADDESAPRYDGISSFTWSPNAHEFLFISDDDVYRYEVPSGEITRLTKTQEREGGVQYLPDGSGYTYSGSGSLRCVRFGSHLIEELLPDLPRGENLGGYELSPNGRRIAFITTESRGSASTQTVNIMTFRGRFAQVQQVPRQVSDDERSQMTYRYYLYDFGDPWREDSTLKSVYSHEVTGPRDVLQTPEWAPDSSKVTWSSFTQNSGLVEIHTAGFEIKEHDEGDEAKDSGEAEESEDSGDDESDENGEEDEDAEEDEGEQSSESEEPEIEITESRVVYRFYHHGGPTTPRMIQPSFLADSKRIVFLSELSGFRHVHVLDPLYESLAQITSGRYEVYPDGISEDHRYLFATATREHPSREEVYAIDLESGEMKRLSIQDGTYDGIAVSNDASKVLATQSTYGELSELDYINIVANEQKTLTDSHPEKAREVTSPAPEFFTYENRHGHQIHGMMFKPDDFDAQRKYPLLIYVYGGPLGTSKQVSDGSYSSASYFFAYYMAKKHGYVAVTIDPRGNSGYGGVFEKANYEQIGKPQVEDLTDGVKFLVANHSVDPKRVGIHGWSFGGFQTQMCMYLEPDVFPVGIAGAGPTEWENYNQWYTTGTIYNTQAVGKEELKQYSLLPLAKNLKGRLLLVHGMEDSNVLYQDTVKLYRELLKAGKEANVELFLDPTGGHGLGGDVKTINRYRKYEDFLLRYLGSGPTDEDAEPRADQ